MKKQIFSLALVCAMLFGVLFPAMPEAVYAEAGDPETVKFGELVPLLNGMPYRHGEDEYYLRINPGRLEDYNLNIMGEPLNYWATMTAIDPEAELEKVTETELLYREPGIDWTFTFTLNGAGTAVTAITVAGLTAPNPEWNGTYYLEFGGIALLMNGMTYRHGEEEFYLRINQGRFEDYNLNIQGEPLNYWATLTSIDPRGELEKLSDSEFRFSEPGIDWTFTFTLNADKTAVTAITVAGLTEPNADWNGTYYLEFGGIAPFVDGVIYQLGEEAIFLRIKQGRAEDYNVSFYSDYFNYWATLTAVDPRAMLEKLTDSDYQYAENGTDWTFTFKLNDEKTAVTAVTVAGITEPTPSWNGVFTPYVHAHNWAEWDCDDTYHWKNCVSEFDFTACPITDQTQKNSFGAHTGMEDGICDQCGYSALVSYEITAGADSEWTKGTDTGLSFTSDAPFEKFLGVKVDGDLIAAENYTAVSGSTVVTLTAAYSETLAVGEHTLTVVSNDGSASCKFTVKAADPTDPADDPTDPTDPADDPTDPADPILPDTGSRIPLFIWTALLAVSGSALIGSAVYGKKRKQAD